MKTPQLLAYVTLIVVCSFLSPEAASQNGSNEYVENAAGNYDYGLQLDIPQGFGEGEFTFEMWVRLDDSYPVGPTSSGSAQRQNWSESDPQPNSSSDWWFRGNFLIDGHTSSPWNQGTFTVQVVAGGRIRWLFGDDNLPTGGTWAVQAWPSSNTPSLLDGAWHQITLVRRWVNASDADLELWIDGAMIATERTPSRQDMRVWWDNWPSSRYGPGREGWFYSAEKQVAIGLKAQFEDYKGLLDEIRFWSRAKSSSEIATSYADPVSGNEPGLVGRLAFSEGQGAQACSDIGSSDCIFLTNPSAGIWSSENAPLMSGGDTQAPTAPPNLQGTAISSARIDLDWGASSDNVGVVDYRIRRDGQLVATTANTDYSDTGLAANTNYSYSVTARDAAGNESTASVTSVTTQAAADTQAPTAPPNLQGTAISSARIDLDWGASSDNVGVVDYRIRRDGQLVATTANTDYSDTGLAANTNYSYSVTARDAAGNESTASVTSVTTQAAADTQAPTAPPNLQGTAISSARIDLDWGASSDNVGVVDYRIRRDGQLVATTANTDYSDTGLAANTNYSYSVTARDAAGNESTASVTSVTTQAAADTQAPTAPPNLQGTAISSARIDLDWGASSDNVGVVDYRIRRDGQLVATTANTDYSDTGLAANTNYSYSVTARDAAGNESTASVTSVTTQAAADTQAPTAPPNLQGTAISSARIDLDWGASSDNVGVVDYRIRRDGQLVATTANTDYSDTGLAANTNYSYSVTARDAAGNESAASMITVTTQQPAADTQAPTAPPNLQGTAISSARIDLDWGASSDNVGVVDYRIRRDGQLVATTPNTDFSDTGLTASTTYIYTVTARDAVGNESTESIVTATTQRTPTDTQAPGAPPNLQGIATSTTRIDLDWGASSDNVGVVDYRVSRDGLLVATTNDTVYSDAGLAANTNYSYSVTARDAAGNESTATVTSVTTPAELAIQPTLNFGGGSTSIYWLGLLLTVACRRRTSAYKFRDLY